MKEGNRTINMTFGALNYRLCAGRFHRKVDGLVGIMDDCRDCNEERECCYPFKPCECVGKRKFWSAEIRLKYDGDEARKRLEALGYDTGKELAEFYVRLEATLLKNSND